MCHETTIVQHDTLINVKQVTSFTDRQHTTDRQKHLPAHLLAVNTETDWLCLSPTQILSALPAPSRSDRPQTHPPPRLSHHLCFSNFI